MDCFFLLVTGSSPRNATVVACVFFPNCGHRYAAVRSAPSLQLLNLQGPPCVPQGEPLFLSPSLLLPYAPRTAGPAMAEPSSTDELVAVVVTVDTLA